MKISPQCFNNSKNVYQVDAAGVFFPCCFVGTEYWQKQYVLTTEEADMLNLSKHTFEEIVNSGKYEKWLEMMEGENPIESCHVFCSKKIAASASSIDSDETWFDGTNTRTVL
jgi:hypothetical protein